MKKFGIDIAYIIQHRQTSHTRDKESKWDTVELTISGTEVYKCEIADTVVDTDSE